MRTESKVLQPVIKFQADLHSFRIFPEVIIKHADGDALLLQQ